MRILQLTVHLFPNIGGVETHLNDLVSSLIKRNWKVFILAYQPLSTKTDWQIFERVGNLTILRIPWIRGFFEKLVYSPILEFIYLVPGLFFVTPFIILLFRPDVLHAHGLIAVVAAVFWGKLFKVKTVISLHSLYTFPKKGFYRDFVKILLKNADFVLSLSKKSNEEVKSLGVQKEKTGIFTYWIDLQRFKKKSNAKKMLGWKKNFIVLFVGRLVKEKGIKILIEAANMWDKKINLVIVGSGPMEDYVLKQTQKLTNVSFLGRIEQSDIPLYFSSSDLVIVPSTSEEGFGRVIIESLACGTPVIASRRGATDEAMDDTVGKFIEDSPASIKKAVEYFYHNPSEIKKLSRNARIFSERRNSEKNVMTIIKAYEE